MIGKAFFYAIQQPLEAVDRQSCVQFMEAQSQAGLSDLTINRRLAAISSLFMELNLLDPERFPQNPVAPLRFKKGIRQTT
jgi:integrase/recombinase XerC